MTVVTLLALPEVFVSPNIFFSNQRRYVMQKLDFDRHPLHIFGFKGLSQNDKSHL
ncbi:MAG: hypothetical protein WCI02_19010 [Planctomycetota bacterium]